MFFRNVSRFCLPSFRKPVLNPLIGKLPELPFRKPALNFLFRKLALNPLIGKLAGFPCPPPLNSRFRFDNSATPLRNYAVCIYADVILSFFPSNN